MIRVELLDTGRLKVRLSPRTVRTGKLGARTSMGRLAVALEELALAAQDGRDTSRRQRAILQRVRRMLRQ
jgi:hypothetical protein